MLNALQQEARTERREFEVGRSWSVEVCRDVEYLVQGFSFNRCGGGQQKNPPARPEVGIGVVV
jgi:hypothetical protein